MQTLGVRERLEGIITERWRPLFQVPEDQYEELTLEFFSSFSLASGTLDDENAVIFCLGGQQRHMSIVRFATLMGLYTQEETADPVFTETIRTVATTTTQTGITQLDLVAWWPQIGNHTWRPSCPASWIRDPVHRFLHRIVASTITGRHQSTEKVTQLDLLVLYCLLRPAPANLATILLTSLGRTRLSAQRLCQGAYVTRLAQSLGVFETFARGDLTAGPPTTHYSLQDMILMEIVTRTQPHRFLDPVPLMIGPAGAEAAGDAPAGDAEEQEGGLAHVEPEPIRRRPPAQPRQRRRAPADAPAQQDVLSAILAHLERQDAMIRHICTHTGVPIPDFFQPPPQDPPAGDE